MRSATILLFKAIVSLGSLLILANSISWNDMYEVLSKAQLIWVFWAFLLFLIAQYYSSLRYLYIAKVLGGSINILFMLKIHFVGLWFNQILPTGLGGDVVKTTMLKDSIGLGIAVKSSILDRLSGLIFLLLSILIFIPLYWKMFDHYPEFILALGVFSFASLVIILLSAWGGDYFQRQRTQNLILLKFLQFFSDIWIFRKKKALWEQTWTSAVVHFAGIASYSLLGLALGIKLEPINFFLVVPLVFLVALVPISFAGWGIRELGAVWLFGNIGISKESALAMSVSFGLLLLTAGLPGLYLYLSNSTSIE